MQDLAAQQIVKIKKVRESQERRKIETSSSGLKTNFLPSKLNELVGRHKLLLASFNTGNAGEYNEIEPINDKLLEKGILI